MNRPILIGLWLLGITSLGPMIRAHGESFTGQEIADKYLKLHEQQFLQLKSHPDQLLLPDQHAQSLEDWIRHISTIGKRFLNKRAVDGYAVTYPSVLQDGRVAQLSGKIYVPHISKKRKMPISLLILPHGTELKKDRVPSNNNEGDDTLVGMVIASLGHLFNHGFAVLMPDYEGMGNAAPMSFHPYCQPASLARSTVDMIQYVQAQWPIGSRFRWDGNLFVMGYSEGAIAALASARELELNYGGSPRLKLTASASMAGPYDLSGAMRRRVVDAQIPYSYPFMFPYLILGLQATYGNAIKPNEIFRQDILDAGLLSQMDGHLSGDEVDKWITHTFFKGSNPIPRDMLKEDWVRNNLEDDVFTESPIGKALIANDFATEGWTLKSPLLLAHSPDDDTVPYENSSLMKQRLQDLGGGSFIHFVPLGTVGDGLTHLEGAVLAFPIATLWFMTYWP